jgi:hypothetical protein
LKFTLDGRGLLRYKNRILQKWARGQRFQAFSFLWRGGLSKIMTKKARTVSAATERARRDAMIGDGVRSGHSAARIAKDLVAVGFAPLSRPRLLEIMKRARGAAPTPLSEDFLATELKRLGELQKALHAKALKGDNAAVDRVLAILDRRAKLLGVATQPSAPESGAADAKTILLQKLDAMAARLAHAPSSADGRSN